VPAEHGAGRGYDLKVFFAVTGKHPQEVRPADVLAFVTAQRAGRAPIGGLLQSVDDDELARVAADGAAPVVQRVRAVRVLARPWGCADQSDAAWAADPAGAAAAGPGVPLLHRVRRLPRILTPAEWTR
jgi:hypothetical protein